MKIFHSLPVLAFALLLGCAKTATPTADSTTPPAEKPIATVNGVAITRDMFSFYVKNATGKTATELTADQRGQLLDNLIRAEVVAQEAEKEGIDKNPDTAALLQFSHVQILEQADAEKYLKDKKPTDAERQTEYDSQIAAMPKTQYHARHILATSQEAAQKAIDEIKKGAKFEDVAKKESIDSSKDQGGDLGWFSPSNMVKPFADAVAGLKKGETTPAPVQSQYGWHVIQLIDTRETPVPPLDSVKDRVDQLIQNKKFKAYQDDLMKTAKIEKNL